MRAPRADRCAVVFGVGHSRHVEVNSDRSDPMATLVDVVGLLVIVGVNTAVAALMTRFFRVRLDSRWGPIVFSLFLTPIALLVLTLLLGGVANLGFDLGSGGAVVAVAIVLPLALGIAFDYFWMPSPEEVELPAQRGEDSPRR